MIKLLIGHFVYNQHLDNEIKLYIKEQHEFLDELNEYPDLQLLVSRWLNSYRYCIEMLKSINYNSIEMAQHLETFYDHREKLKKYVLYLYQHDDLNWLTIYLCVQFP